MKLLFWIAVTGWVLSLVVWLYLVFTAGLLDHSTVVMLILFNVFLAGIAITYPGVEHDA